MFQQRSSRKMQQEHKLIDAYGGVQLGSVTEFRSDEDEPLCNQAPTQMRHFEIGHKQQGQGVAHLPSPQRRGEHVLMQPMSPCGVPEISSPSFIMEGQNHPGESNGKQANNFILIPMIFDSTQCTFLPAGAAIDEFPINAVPDCNTAGKFQNNVVLAAERFGNCQAVSQGLSCNPSGIAALEKLLTNAMPDHYED